MPATSCATLTDVTSSWAVIGLMGPLSRALLSRVTRQPLDNAHFPFGALREIAVDHATVWAARRSYVGELGWEIYAPTEFAATVYDALHAAGADLGLRDAGYYAIESLRIEKGYRAWGRELSPDATPWQTGTGFAVRLDKGADFIGRDALLSAKGKPLKKRVVSFLAMNSDTPIAWGGELITADDAPVGEVTSAAFGYTLGALAGLGWIRSGDEPLHEKWIEGRSFAIDIAGESVPVRVSLQPFYDPKSERMRV